MLLVLSLILPTFNEAANIANLLDVLDGVLAGIPHEIIVVDDDSPDGTWQVAGAFAEKHASVKVVRRLKNKGLSSAVVDGFDAAHGTVLAVMDADGQHDSALLLSLVRAISQGADISIGSRYVEGGSVGSWVADRRIISNLGTFLAKMLSRVRVSDPLGGFFAIRADLYRSIRSSLRPSGFKILLEILAAVPPHTRLVEVPLVFRMRLHGHSKLSFGVHMAFIAQVIRLALRGWTGMFTRAGMSIFLLLSIGTGFFLLPRAFALRLLYTDSSVRDSVRSALTTVADKQGWLLSDIRIISVSSEVVRFSHQDHLRLDIPPKTCTLRLFNGSFTCEK